MKSLDDLCRQEERIIAKHPYLLDVDFRPVVQSSLTAAEIARFMDDAWKHTYQGRERFIYDEPYLRWAFGWKGFDSDLSLLACKGERLVGFILLQGPYPGRQRPALPGGDHQGTVRRAYHPVPIPATGSKTSFCPPETS